MTTTKTLAERERDEVARSVSDAEKAMQRDLHMPDVARYLNPPTDTIHAREYCYALLGDVRGKTILDLGCGDGADVVALAKRGAHVIGVDLSPDLIGVAERRVLMNCTAHECAAVELRVGSAHDLPLFDQSVDLVFGVAILHHLDLNLAAREVARVLRPGGRAIFQEPIRNSGLVRAVRRAIPYATPDVSPDERPLTDAELNHFAEAAGFALVRSKAFMLPTSNLLKVVPWIGPRTVRARQRWDAWLLRRLPSLRYYASLRVMECWV